MAVCLQQLLCLWVVSQLYFIDAATTGNMQVVNYGTSKGNMTTGEGRNCFCLEQPSEPSDTLCAYCASLQCSAPTNLPVGWGNQDVIGECVSCSEPFKKDCYCNKKFHPRGCTLRDCGPEDGVAYPDRVVGYTCYCTEDYKPYDCVSRSNPSHPRCEPSEPFDVRDDCQCDTETSDPDNCNIRVCDPDELTGDGYRCICGPRCDQRPDGCVKEIKV